MSKGVPFCIEVLGFRAEFETAGLLQKQWKDKGSFGRKSEKLEVLKCEMRANGLCYNKLY